jgi:hypothetical protein
VSWADKNSPWVDASKGTGRLRLRSRIQSDIQGVCDTTENGMAFRGDINTLFNMRTKRM